MSWTCPWPQNVPSILPGDRTGHFQLSFPAQNSPIPSSRTDSVGGATPSSCTSVTHSTWTVPTRQPLPLISVASKHHPQIHLAPMSPMKPSLPSHCIDAFPLLSCAVFFSFFDLFLLMAILYRYLHPSSPQMLIPQYAYSTHFSLTNGGSTELLGAVPIS